MMSLESILKSAKLSLKNFFTILPERTWVDDWADSYQKPNQYFRHLKHIDMKTKQEVIQEAYGEHWEKVKNHIDEHGWLHRRVTGHGTTNELEYDRFGYDFSTMDFNHGTSSGDYEWRPKSLRGVENNNGWIRVEDALPDFTKPACVDVWCREQNREMKEHLINSPILMANFKDRNSHWKPSEVIKPPLY